MKVLLEMNLDEASEQMRRKLELKRLRLKGDFYHNIKALKIGGELIVYRRPNHITDVADYKPCKFCYLFLHKNELWRHTQKCSFKSSENERGAYSLAQHSNLLLYPHTTTPGCNVELHEAVLAKMNNDEIANVVKKDSLILSFGSFLLSGKGVKKSGNISQTMRLLGRLLQQLRIAVPNMIEANLIDFISPRHFEAIVDSTKVLAGYMLCNDDGELLPTFKTPSLPLKLGYALENVANLVHGLGLKRNNPELIRDAKGFCVIYRSEWSVRVSSASLRTLADNKYDKVHILPLTEDLLKIKKFCTEQTRLLTESLISKPTLQAWRSLAEITVTRITIFNKRRGDEPSSLLLKRYERKKDYSQAVHKDKEESLTQLERTLVKRLKHFSC